MPPFRRPLVVILAGLCVSGCVPYLGLEIVYSHPRDSAATEDAGVAAIEAEEIERVRGAIDRIAKRHGLQRQATVGERRIEDVASREGYRLLSTYYGPYPPSWVFVRDDAAAGLDLTLWLSQDRTTVRVTLVDWRDAGETQRLASLRDEILFELKETLPGYRTEIEQFHRHISP